MRCLLTALLALALLAAAPPARATDSAHGAPADKEKAEKKKSKIDPYERMLGPNFLYLEGYEVSTYVGGRLGSGRIRLTLEATDELAADTLDGQKEVIDSILYPLVVDLFADGTPNARRIEQFKTDAVAALRRQFDTVVAVYVRDVL